MAVALSGAAQPGSAVPSFDLPDDEVELGVGIHGERAASRAPFGTAGELVRRLVDPLVADLELRRGDGVLVFVTAWEPRTRWSSQCASARCTGR
jgi:phosphoenolpyruvate---glycerone phosphotransferase subunit DhaK